MIAPAFDISAHHARLDIELIQRVHPPLVQTWTLVRGNVTAGAIFLREKRMNAAREGRDS